MRRREKAGKIGEQLDELYPKTPIPLLHSDPYTLLVAVMLSAQTTDKKVNEVTPGLFEIADSPENMAALDVTEIKTKNKYFDYKAKYSKVFQHIYCLQKFL